MIAFFRRIRKKMADANKPMKYTRYAIGEIVLVVIGILIALQINNWNEERKDDATEIVFLRGLILNIKDDIDALDESLVNVYRKMESLAYISNRFYEQNEDKNDSILKNHLINMWGLNIFSNNSFVFEGIKSSGKLNLIASDELLFEILSYYHYSAKVLSSQEINNANINQLMFEPNFRNKIDINSVIEPLFTGPLSSKTNDFDSSFFSIDPRSSEVREFSNSLSGIKGFLGVNQLDLRSLRAKAAALNTKLKLYLGTKEVIGTTLGHPHILVNGKANYHEIEIQDRERMDNWIVLDSNQINVNYPNDVGYGVIRFIDKKIKGNRSKSADYSSYKSISLELKGELGGEEVLITFLDTDDLADGSEIKSTIVLTDEWKIYELNLDQFPNTNFESLIESPVLVLQQEAVSYKIKNIEFKK